MDKNGFKGNNQGNNDSQVNLTSQLGGLNNIKFRSVTNETIPTHGEIYNNTVHSSFLIQAGDQNVVSELYSLPVQKDVAILLQSPQDKFANAIGIGSCKS